jgi:hypothetical protein
LIGNFKNPGVEWCQSEEPVEVLMHDFVDPKLGKAIPYGIYDVTLNQGWVNVGIDHDTTELDAIAIERDTFHGEWNYIIKPLIAI